MEQDAKVPVKSFRSSQETAAVLKRVFQDYPHQNFAIRLWDGTTVRSAPEGSTRFTLVLRHPGAVASMLRTPLERSLGEAFIFNDVDVEGDLQDVFELSDYLLQRRWTLADKLRFALHGLKVVGRQSLRDERIVPLKGRSHEKERDRQAVRFHYDVPSEFYELWLDRRLVYSCAYFTGPDDDLDSAQTEKLDYLCRKLRLRPGDRLLDIGCGWGALAVYAAQHYGATVHGITLSHRQAEVARARIAASGLSRRCSVEIRDYRDVRGENLYDKVVSVGMVEHVGRAQLPEYFRQACRLLRPGGVFLNHGIGSRDGDGRLGPFASRYVFPDAEVVPLHEIVAVAEGQQLEVRDVESLREHYALTLTQWVKRLESQRDRAVAIVGETIYRTWRLYMAASAYFFRKGTLNVYQTLCAKAMNGLVDLPLTRDDWYKAPSGQSVEWGGNTMNSSG